MQDTLVMLSLELVEKLCVTIVVAYLITRTRYFWRVVENTAGAWDQLILILVFGGFSIYGTYSGVHLIGAIANTRDLAPLVAGLIGGPAVGIGAGIIGGLHRYSLGGFSCLPCALATIIAGGVGGLAYHLNKRQFIGVLWATILAACVEALHMLLTVLIARPLTAAIELVRAVSLPMTVANAVGVAIFSLIVVNLIRERRTSSERDRYYTELEHKIFEMERLYRMGLQVSSTLDIAIVLDLCISTTVEVLEAQAGALFLVDEKTGELVGGPVAHVRAGPGAEDQSKVHIVQRRERLETADPLAAVTLERKEAIHWQEPPAEQLQGNLLQRVLGIPALSILSVPLQYKDDTIGVIQVWNRRDGKPFSTEDEQVLVSFAVHAAIAIENARLYQQVAEQERVKRELEIAHRLQTSLLPERAPSLPGFEIAAQSIPAKEVGGDFFDFVPLGAQTTGIVIGDVAGKGLPAALFMALSRSFLRAEAIGGRQPHTVLQRTNQLIADDAREGMFVTAQYATLSGPTKTLTLSNAGHNPVLLYHSNRQTHEQLRMPGIALGALEDSQFSEIQLRLAPGDIALLYTDGLTETVNQTGSEQFGLARVVQLLEANAERGAAELMELIVSRVLAFGDEQPQFDDITLIVIKALS